jgi:hypothetical protein
VFILSVPVHNFFSLLLMLSTAFFIPPLQCEFNSISQLRTLDLVDSRSASEPGHHENKCEILCWICDEPYLACVVWYLCEIVSMVVSLSPSPPAPTILLRFAKGFLFSTPQDIITGLRITASEQEEWLEKTKYLLFQVFDDTVGRPGY